MTMRWPLSQQQEMQDHLAAMETGGTVSADSLASHLLQLQSRIMPFNFQLLASSTPRGPTENVPRATATPARTQDKEKCSSQCRKGHFFKGTWSISLCSFGARTTLATFQSHLVVT